MRAPRSRSYQSRLDRVIDYVHENLQQRLTAEQLADVACFSRFHFHRVFTATMGETPGVFVRRARLERAARLMQASPRRRIGSIAMEVGFSSFSDFSRVFRRHYGVAPSRWDRRSRLEWEPSGSGADALLPSPCADDDLGDDPEPALVQMPETSLAYVRVTDPTADGSLARGYERLRRWLRSNGLPVPGDEAGPVPGEALLGMSWDDDERTPPHLLRYDFACPVPPGIRGSDGISLRTLPPLLCVSARATGGLGRVARTWDFLYGSWLPSSKWEPYHLPAFERFHRQPGEGGWDVWDLDCCIPLEPLRDDAPRRA